MQNFQQKEKELSDRIQYLASTKEDLQRKNEEAFREMNSIQQNLINEKKSNTSEETRWETEK